MDASKDRCGFFGSVGNSERGAKISNISLINVSYNDNHGMIGGLFGDGSADVNNCHVTGNIVGIQQTGGLIGHLSGGLITNCSTFCNLSSSGQFFIGGLIGKLTGGAVINCSARGNMYNFGTNAGGLIGSAQQSSLIGNKGIINCFSSVNLSSRGGIEGRNIGGLIGYNNYHGPIINCYATGNVEVEGSDKCKNDRVGGLIGFNDGERGNVEVNDCYATGNVNVVNETEAEVGGLIGHIENQEANIRNCYATGNVSNEKGKATGGLIGADYIRYNNDNTCNNTALNFQISGLSNVGRVVGYIHNEYRQSWPRNNSAWKGMVVNGVFATEDRNNGTDAESSMVWKNLSFWKNILGDNSISTDNTKTWNIVNIYSEYPWGIPYLTHFGEPSSIDAEKIQYLKPSSPTSSTQILLHFNNESELTQKVLINLGVNYFNTSLIMPEYPGYIFNGYKTRADRVMVIDGTLNLIPSVNNFTTSDGRWNSTLPYLDLIGDWSIIPIPEHETTLRLNNTLNGTTQYVNVTVNSSSFNTSIVIPTFEGYTFDGWNTSVSGGLSIINSTGSLVPCPGYVNESGCWINSTVDSLEVYAQWIKAPSPEHETTLLLNNTLNGTTQYVNVTVNSSSFNTSIVIPTFEGYTFDGWNTSVSGGLSIINSTGSLVPCPGYVNESGCWINSTVDSLEVYAQWIKSPEKPIEPGSQALIDKDPEAPKGITAEFESIDIVGILNISPVNETIHSAVKNNPIPGETVNQILTSFSIDDVSQGGDFNLTLSGIKDSQVSKVKVYHNKLTGGWEDLKPLPGSPVKVDDSWTFTFHSDSFSPFVGVIVEPNVPPSPPHRGGGGGGTTIITSQTPMPTVTPTVTPTSYPVQPTSVSPSAIPTVPATQQSPVPFIGILSGLAVGGFLLTRLRK